MLIEFPILTYIVLIPAVGAVFTYLTGSDRAARAVALAFSLVVLGLSTVLLLGFLWPNVISLPTMATPGNHTYFAVEETPVTTRTSRSKRPPGSRPSTSITLWGRTSSPWSSFSLMRC